VPPFAEDADGFDQDGGVGRYGGVGTGGPKEVRLHEDAPERASGWEEPVGIERVEEGSPDGIGTVIRTRRDADS
jgi:hypothetical protein